MHTFFQNGDNNFTNHLQYVDVKFWTDDQCSKAFEADYGHKFVNGSEICAYEEVGYFPKRI